jgi:hypothetical protein
MSSSDDPIPGLILVDEAFCCGAEGAPGIKLLTLHRANQAPDLHMVVLDSLDQLDAVTSSRLQLLLWMRRGVQGCGLCLLEDLLDHPPEEVRDLLFDPEPFELGDDLTAVVGREIDNVAQYRPRRQGESPADRAASAQC